MSPYREAKSAVIRRRDRWHTGIADASTRWADRGLRRWSRWKREGIDRCRRWADEGSHRAGELAPPSWFSVGMAAAIAWYRITGSVPQAWYRLAGTACRILARTLYWALTAVSYLPVCVPRVPRGRGHPS